ncbi:hypothetical protein APHAL10511_007117 [Amanita phalloides]|nr:hypothetical protein APHAL10511_007117 [Amanita phalloides]
MPFLPCAVRVFARKAASHTSASISKSLRKQPPPFAVLGVHTFSTNRAATSKAGSLFTHSRTLLSRLFAHLLAPNLRIPLAPSLSGRALHSSVLRAYPGRATIKQGLSFPTRVAVSRPFGLGSFIPRSPIPPARVATNLGLGPVRTFTSGQPLFQNLVENVPVAVRALYKADVNPKPLFKCPERQVVLHPKAHSPIKARKDERWHLSTSNEATTESITPSEELDHYFATPESTVTTYLLVPLAPSPSSRLPLALSSPPTTANACNPTLLHPLSELSSLHLSHELHAIRVSSLFSRLDHGDVWSKGVRCSAFAHGSAHIWEDEGSCTILKLEFVGWSKAEVQSVIGECGTGWCIMYEEHEEEFADMESDFSSEPDDKATFADPAQSLVLPVLDVASAHDTSLDSSYSQLSFMGSDPWLEGNLDS